MPRLSDLGVVVLLDEAKGDLGEVALELVHLGIDTLYSNDAHEATLLIRQEGRRVGGALVNADTSVSHLDSLIETLAVESGLHPEAIAVIGNRPADGIVQAYLDRGLRWCLWRPFAPDALHFIGNLALWETNEASLRLHLRVPTRLDAKLSCRGQTQPARVSELSRGGARLEVTTRLPPGRRVQLQIDAGGSWIACTAIVRWTSAFRPATDPPTAPQLGVEFENPGWAMRASLRALLEAALARFRIQTS